MRITPYSLGNRAIKSCDPEKFCTGQFFVCELGIHTRNLQTLTTEMLKVYKDLSPAIIDLFHVRQNNYNLRLMMTNDSYFAIPNVYYGTESLSNLGSRILHLVPNKLKQLLYIHAFKKEIKKWKPENCLCRLCKFYIPNIGFI